MELLLEYHDSIIFWFLKRNNSSGVSHIIDGGPQKKSGVHTWQMTWIFKAL